MPLLHLRKDQSVRQDSRHSGKGSHAGWNDSLLMQGKARVSFYGNIVLCPVHWYVEQMFEVLHLMGFPFNVFPFLSSQFFLKSVLFASTRRLASIEFAFWDAVSQLVMALHSRLPRLSPMRPSQVRCFFNCCSHGLFGEYRRDSMAFPCRGCLQKCSKILFLFLYCYVFTFFSLSFRSRWCRCERYSRLRSCWSAPHHWCRH